jgi:long-chain acyl-CoA synthetase
MSVLRPTLFASVPRLLNRIHDKIVQGAMHSGSAVKAALFSRALNAKLDNMHNNGSLDHALWDALVFKKVKALLGGRVRLVITASAPISSSVLDLLRVSCGAQVIEAYGQTESTGGLTLSLRNDFHQGHVGCVVPQYLKIN